VPEKTNRETAPGGPGGQGARENRGGPAGPAGPGRAGAYAVDLDAVRAAADRIAPHAHRTPVLTSRTIDGRAGASVFFKCENFQRVGAFKFRGALNAVLRLPEEAAQRGVVTHSSGNHAQALALAARIRGIDAYIVMPDNAPSVKRDAVVGYGARVIDCLPTLKARETTVEAVLAETGGTLVHPYNDPDIIAGQGTCVAELIDAVPDLDAVIAPVGGGGLLSGTAIAATALEPGIRVFGAEPTGADDAARSLAAGHLIEQTNPDTIADGLLTSLGSLTWPIIRDHVERIITVTDEEIRAAMLLVMERMKIVIEPSAAVPVAAALSGELTKLGVERLGLIVTGGNIALDRLTA